MLHGTRNIYNKTPLGTTGSDSSYMDGLKSCPNSPEISEFSTQNPMDGEFSMCPSRPGCEKNVENFFPQTTSLLLEKSGGEQRSPDEPDCRLWGATVKPIGG